MQAPSLVQNAISIADVPIDNTLDIATGFGLGAADGDFLPIVKVQPIYPRRALQRGISGYVVVEFTVTKSGSVTDVKVVEEEPSGIFSRSAMNAASKFKYKPRIVDGKAVDVIGVRNKIVFNIEE